MARSRKAQKKHPMFLNPCGKLKDWEFGVLRAVYNGKPNTAQGFVEAKLERCSASAVLLPDSAADALLDHKSLWSSFEAARWPHQADLATVATIYLPSPLSLHAAFEEVRAWAHMTIVRQRELPASVILHVPALSGSPNDPHAHVVIAARTLGPWGWEGFSKLLRDDAQIELHESWLAHRAAWRTGQGI